MAGVPRLLSGRLPAALSNRVFTTTSALKGGTPKTFDIRATREELHPAIGKREILCWGFNGDPSQYVGDPAFPANSVRFQEDSDYVANVLRPKEAGDWREMTLEEKKTLYRTAYQQTCVEYINQKRGRWKIDLNYCLLIFIGTTLWTMWTQRYMGQTRFFEDEEYRASVISDVYTSQPLNEIYGDFDYKTGEWKKKRPRWDWI